MKNGNKKGNEIDAQALREKALENLHTLRTLDAENELDAIAGPEPEGEHMGRSLVKSISMNDFSVKSFLSHSLLGFKDKISLESQIFQPIPLCLRPVCRSSDCLLAVKRYSCWLERPVVLCQP